MIATITDSYQEYKIKKELYEWTKTKITLWSSLVVVLFMTPLIWWMNPSMKFIGILMGSSLFSLLAGSCVPMFLSDFDLLKKYKVPSLDDFAFNHLKKKYANCIWLNHCIVFQKQDKFYKVEQLKKFEDCLQIISVETKPFQVDSIT